MPKSRKIVQKTKNYSKYHVSPGIVAVVGRAFTRNTYLTGEKVPAASEMSDFLNNSGESIGGNFETAGASEDQQMMARSIRLGWRTPVVEHGAGLLRVVGGVEWNGAG
ncbi:hypothetical protein Q1695_014495 [Nippostrongylus brasiliensis]|nr:hypothetical protein Q1695_014495 [Nippostrongylus brasiliensis]